MIIYYDMALGILRRRIALKNKVLVTLFVILGVSIGLECYSRFVVKDKREENQRKITELLSEKKEKEEKLLKIENKFKVYDNENKDLKAMKEVKK